MGMLAKKTSGGKWGTPLSASWTEQAYLGQHHCNPLLIVGVSKTANAGSPVSEKNSSRQFVDEPSSKGPGAPRAEGLWHLASKLHLFAGIPSVLRRRLLSYEHGVVVPGLGRCAEPHLGSPLRDDGKCPGADGLFSRNKPHLVEAIRPRFVEVVELQLYLLVA